MSDSHCTKPICLIIFNRPETTAQVFAQIAHAKPSVLLVVADGPRSDRPGEAERCAAARAIVDRVDWKCDVLTHFAESNMGCRARVSSGITWAFEQVDEAIVLEDDCVAHPTFFPFCEELLERYREDERVMMIAGANLQFGRCRGAYSYYFSHYSHVWGWATWRRAWRHYDVDMALWPTMQSEDRLLSILCDRKAAAAWSTSFQALHEKRIDTWDGQWQFTLWAQNGLAIVPNVNLVSNIGFAADATHTTSPTSRQANMHAEGLAFPLRHPPYMIRHRDADAYLENTIVNVRWPYKLRLAVGKVKRLAARWISRWHQTRQ